jgi:uncharacterized Fe-S center protein
MSSCPSGSVPAWFLKFFLQYLLIMKRRSLLSASVTAVGISPFFPSLVHASEHTRAEAKITSGSLVNTLPKDRPGKESVVYFTSDLSAEGLARIYQKVGGAMRGKVAVKLHTGEKNGPNIIPRPWVQKLMEGIPGATIVETNTYYEGDRYTTEQHRDTLKVNGWTFAPVDIMDENGTVMLPIVGGKHFKEMSMGKNILAYDSMLVLTHFKGHTMGGFGGSNKNIGIGCADGRIGKKMIHTYPGQGQWSISEDEFMERMTESSKAVLDHFKENIVYINVMRNMSVDCDCAGLTAAKPTVRDVGILASTDILAIDQASVDLIYDLGEGSKDIRERMESRHGLRQLSYMQELGMGSPRYRLVTL